MSSSRVACLLLPVMLVFLQSTEVHSQCEPVEEGKSFSITCSGGACTRPLLFWWRTLGSTAKHISYCDTNADCTGNNEFFTIGIVQTVDGYESKLTIGKVSRTNPFNNEVTWRCEYCGGSVTNSCKLQIYVKPVNVECRATEVTDSSGRLSKITLQCTMDNVYPDEKCQFKLGTGDNSVALPQQSTGACNNTIDVSELGDGRNVIRAVVGSSLQPDFDQIQPIPVTPDIVLRLPRAGIKCPGFEYKDGYYKGETVTCMCSLEDPGKPAGRAAFFESTNEYQNYSRTHTSPAANITCAGESAIGRQSPGNKFTPKFAFLRPNAIVFTTTYEGGSDNSSNTAVLAICEIAASEVNPPPRIVFLVNGKEASRSSSQANANGDPYRSTLRFRPKVGGLFKLACRTENTVFSELVDEAPAKNITIHSSVQLADAFEAREYYYAKIEPDNKLAISVDITAYPEPTNFTLFRGNPSQNVTADNYEVQYVEWSPSTGTVELGVSVESPSDLASYSLVVDNGVGDRLVYSFTVEEDTEEDITYVYIIVGAVAGAILIVAIILLVWWRKRRTKSDNGNLETDYTTGEINNGHEEENVYSEPKEESEEEDVYEPTPIEEPKLKSPPVRIPPPPAPKPKKPKVSKNIGNNNGKGNVQNVGGDTTKQVPNSKPNDNVGASRPKVTPKGKAQKQDKPYVNIDKESSNPKVPRHQPPVPITPSEEELYVNYQKKGTGSKGDVSSPQDEDGDYLHVLDSSRSEDTYYSAITEGGCEAVMY